MDPLPAYHPPEQSSSSSSDPSSTINSLQPTTSGSRAGYTTNNPSGRPHYVPLPLPPNPLRVLAYGFRIADQAIFECLRPERSGRGGLQQLGQETGGLDWYVRRLVLGMIYLKAGKLACLFDSNDCLADMFSLIPRITSALSSYTRPARVFTLGAVSHHTGESHDTVPSTSEPVEATRTNGNRGRTVWMVCVQEFRRLGQESGLDQVGTVLNRELMVGLLADLNCIWGMPTVSALFATCLSTDLQLEPLVLYLI